jgi:hypothetical protein
MICKKKLVTFGDSWPQGSELLPNEKTFGQILSEYLKCTEYSNYSVPASSINHLMVQLQKYISWASAFDQDLSEWMAVFFLTDQSRAMTWYDNNWIFQSSMGGGGLASSGAMISETNRIYFKYIYSKELSDITTNTVLVSLQAMCRYHGIKDYYITGWQQFDFWPEVDTTCIYRSGKVSCGDLIGLEPGDSYLHKNPNVMPGGHPSQKGHQIIADALYQWILESEPLAH